MKRTSNSKCKTRNETTTGSSNRSNSRNKKVSMKKIDSNKTKSTYKSSNRSNAPRGEEKSSKDILSPKTIEYSKSNLSIK